MLTTEHCYIPLVQCASPLLEMPKAITTLADKSSPKFLRLVPFPSKSEVYILPSSTASSLPCSFMTLSNAAPYSLSPQLRREPGTGQWDMLRSGLNDRHLPMPVQTWPSGITYKSWRGNKLQQKVRFTFPKLPFPITFKKWKSDGLACGLDDGPRLICCEGLG